MHALDPKLLVSFSTRIVLNLQATCAAFIVINSILRKDSQRKKEKIRWWQTNVYANRNYIVVQVCQTISGLKILVDNFILLFAGHQLTLNISLILLDQKFLKWIQRQKTD